MKTQVCNFLEVEFSYQIGERGSGKVATLNLITE